MVPPCGVDVAALQKGLNFTSLARAVKANLHTIGGWSANLADGVHASVVNCETFAASCDVASAEHTPEARTSIETDFAAHEPRNKARKGASLRSTTAVPVEEKAPKKSAPKAIQISGADGPSQQQVNGVYMLQEEKFNGKDVFRKESAPDVWLAFVHDRWYVTDTQRKDDHTGGGWLYSSDDSSSPMNV